MSGVKSCIFFAMRMMESLMHITEPSEIPFRISMLRQYAWCIGSTDKITVCGPIFMSRHVAFSARLFCVSMTPLLFPVVPDVNMIVQSASSATADSWLPLLSSISPLNESTCGQCSVLFIDTYTFIS